MTKKTLKKNWVVGDVLEKGKLKIVIHRIEEEGFAYLYNWLVLNTKSVFPADVMLQKGWKKTDKIEPYSITLLKKSKHYNAVHGVC